MYQRPHKIAKYVFMYSVCTLAWRDEDEVKRTNKKSFDRVITPKRSFYDFFIDDRLTTSWIETKIKLVVISDKYHAFKYEYATKTQSQKAKEQLPQEARPAVARAQPVVEEVLEVANLY